MTVVVIA